MTFRSHSAVVLLAILMLTSVKASRAQDKSKPLSAEQLQVVNTVKTIFAAAEADDLAKFHSVTAPGFYIFDNGKRFDGDAIMELIKTLQAAGNRLPVERHRSRCPRQRQQCLDCIRQPRQRHKCSRQARLSVARICGSAAAVRRLEDRLHAEHAGSASSSGKSRQLNRREASRCSRCCSHELFEVSSKPVQRFESFGRCFHDL